MIIITFLKTSTLRTSVNYLIVNMAISDLISAATNWPLASTEGLLSTTLVIGGSTAFEKRAPREGHEGGVLIPFPSRLYFLIPAQIPQSQPVLLKFKSHSHFLLFLFHESQSQCTKSHFPASKKTNPSSHFTPSRPSLE